MTYVCTATGWLYLAAVLDLYSRKVVGWATATSMPGELVCAALRMAIDLRQPQPGMIVHTDRGSQYASHAHRALRAKHGLIASMSRKGNCWDNAVMERFFLNLKMERLWQRRYATSTTTSSPSTTHTVCIPRSDTLHPPISKNLTHKTLTSCPIKLDHDIQHQPAIHPSRISCSLA